MKKVIVALTVLAIVCLFGFTAFAAPTSITVNGKELAITVINDFSTYSAENNYVSASNDVTFDGEKMIAAAGSGYWYGDGPAMPSVDASAYEGANYLGFQIKNNGTDPIYIAFESSSTQSSTGSWALQYVDNTIKPLLVTSTGITEAGTLDISGIYRGFAAEVPGSFDGWLFFDMTSLNNAGDISYSRPQSMGIAGCHTVGTASSIEIDNLAVAASMELPSDTADLSVIAYAAAALVGCGALAIGKKRA